MLGSDFTKSRIGDRAWHIRFGKSEIVRINEDVGVWFRPDHSGFIHCIGFDGRVEETDLLPSLYHDEIKFEIPPPPKRMVKKKFEHWDLATNNGRLIGCAFKTKKEAEERVIDNDYELFVYPTLVSYEIEVEE
jgi:hypothetical protein